MNKVRLRELLPETDLTSISLPQVQDGQELVAAKLICTQGKRIVGWYSAGTSEISNMNRSALFEKRDLPRF